MPCYYLFLKYSLLLVFLQSIVSLSFGSENTDAADTIDALTDLESNDQVSASVRGAASTVSKKEFSIGSIVEAFFQNQPDTEISNKLKESFRQMANEADLKDFLKATRRSLHRHPDIMYQESFASRTIKTILDELDIRYSTGWGKNTHEDVIPGKGGYGVVADIGTLRKDQPCIILRADMDALPIRETTEGINAFKSSSPGKMHACGHDGHVTMLLGAAALLKKLESQIMGTVRLVFQPAEEGGAGLKRMVEEGVIDITPKAQYAFAMHVWPM